MSHILDVKKLDFECFLCRAQSLRTCPLWVTQSVDPVGQFDQGIQVGGCSNFPILRDELETIIRICLHTCTVYGVYIYMYI